MKINFKKMQSKDFYIYYIYQNGSKPKNESDVVTLLKTCVRSLKQAQAGRRENTLGESWVVEALEELIDCIELKKATE